MVVVVNGIHESHAAEVHLVLDDGILVFLQRAAFFRAAILKPNFHLEKKCELKKKVTIFNCYMTLSKIEVTLILFHPCVNILFAHNKIKWRRNRRDLRQIEREVAGRKAVRRSDATDGASKSAAFCAKKIWAENKIIQFLSN